MGFVFAVDFKRSAKPHFHINFYLCFRPISEGAVIFCKKMTGGVFSQFDVTYLNSFSFALLNSFALLRCPILLMRLGAPHKIDRYANRCSLYPPQAAVAYVARQRKAWFCKHFNLIFIFGGSKPPPYRIDTTPVGTALAAVRQYDLYVIFYGQGSPLSANPQKSVATASRREGVYNRAGEPSVIFAEKEELQSERETAKGCCERYGANDDAVRSTHTSSLFTIHSYLARKGE